MIFSCHKTSSINPVTGIVGKWRYTSSTADTAINGQWLAPQTGYDSTLGANFSDSLQFTASDTLYYIYNGQTSWSNYKVTGNYLILLGNGNSNTLIIHRLTSTALSVGDQTSTYYYWAGFTRYQ
jgi:hypothetical protein